jgi:hypothetical protein
MCIRFLFSVNRPSIHIHHVRTCKINNYILLSGNCIYFFYFTDISIKGIKILNSLFYVILLPSIQFFFCCSLCYIISVNVNISGAFALLRVCGLRRLPIFKKKKKRDLRIYDPFAMNKIKLKFY